MPNRPIKKSSKAARSALKIEALESRQLLAGIVGAGTEVGKDIAHPNGNIYDQVLMTGASVTVTADPGQVTRVSFLDAQGDIVQAEFAGAGSLTVSLAGATGPVAPDKYNQAVNYMKGTATFTIQGSDSTTNFGVFSVGTSNATGGAANPIFTDSAGAALTGGNNTADIQRITIVANPSQANGSTFGGIRAGNAVFSGSSGVVGITAANVQIQDVVTIGDIDASSSAIPTLIFGTDSQFGLVTVAGGDLVNTNGVSINNTGSYAFQVALAAGATSGGTALPAATQSPTVNFTGTNPFNLVNNTFTLTTAPDQIPGLVGTAGTGTSGNDTINGSLGGADPTFTALDAINAGTGTDTFNLIDLTGGSAQPAGTSISAVETVNFRSVAAANLDVSTWTGVTALNVTQATSAILTAPSTTAVTVTGVTGGVTVTGGSTQSITSQQGASTITSNGGTTIGITSTGNTGGTITVGGTTAPTGAVTVSSTGTAPADIVSTKESFTFKVNDTTEQGDTVIFDGTTVTLVDSDATGGADAVSVAEAATQIGAATYANWTTSVAGDTVTFTAKTGGNRTDVTLASFGGTSEVVAGVAPTIVVTSGTPAAMGAIAVTGGTTVSVTESVGTKSTTLTSGLTITEGAITVTGGTATTSVTVTEDPTATAVNAVAAIASTKEVTEVTFSALTTGQTAVVGGLTFTAAKDLTAEQVAAAFANLVRTSVGSTTTGATNGPAAVSSGTYSGSLSTSFGSGAASGTKVTFTAVSAGTVADITFGGTGTNPTGSTTQGTASTSAVTGVIGVVAGAVTITDAGTEADTITTVSLSGFGAGSTVNSDVLSTVMLANSVDDVALTTAAAMTSLNLTANGLGTSSSSATNTAVLNTGATYTTINLNATGANSFLDITAGGVTTLAVTGDKVADLTGSGTGLNTVKTVTVAGSAGLKLPTGAATALTSLTSTSTGGVTASVNPTTATVSTGAGADVITTTAAAPTKAISLGAGDDELILVSGTTSATSVLDGGDGTDTLTFAVPMDAAGATATALFEAQIQGFEKLGLQAFAAGSTNQTINLDNLDDINYVVSAGSTAAVAAVAGAKEVAVVTFAGDPTGDKTFIFDGVTVAYTSDGTPTLAEFLDKVDGVVYPNWTVTASDATTITFQRNTEGNVTDLSATSFTGTFDDAGTSITGVVITPGATAVAAVAAGGALTLDKMMTGGTVELTGAAVTTTVSELESDSSADTFNVITKASGDLSAGTVTLTKVETVNYTATDTSTGTINTHTIDIKAAAATAINITGNAHVTLTPDASNVVLASIDGSAMTGRLSASGGGTVSTTVKGGSGADTLTAGFTGDSLMGNGGDDHLIVNSKSLVQLTGGAGNDRFNVSGATSNVTAFATITDLTAGDVIKFADSAGTETFASVAIKLDPTTAVFQNFADEVIKTTAQGAVGWFQFGGDTYVIEHVQAGGTSFLNGTDIVVKIAGLKDLSTASFNASNQTLLIV